MLGMVSRPKQIRKSKLDILSKESFESIYRACKGNCAAIALAVKLMLQETQPEFSVSRSAVRRYLLSRYPELRPQKLDPVPFFVEPGQQLQIDLFSANFGSRDTQSRQCSKSLKLCTATHAVLFS